MDILANIAIDEATLAYLRARADAVEKEAEAVEILRDFAAGRHATRLDARQLEYLGPGSLDSARPWSDNACGYVLRQYRDHLEAASFKPNTSDGAELAKIAWDWWQANNFDAEAKELYKAACRDESAYLIVTWDAKKNRPDWAINLKYCAGEGIKYHIDPSTKDVEFASKTWMSYDEKDKNQPLKLRKTLYYPDRVEKYVQVTRDSSGWAPVKDPGDLEWPIKWVDKDGEPLGVAVIPFDNPDGSDLIDIIPLQKALNKSELDLLASEDYTGFGAYWATGVGVEKDANGVDKEIRISPGILTRVTAPDARFGKFEPSSLDPQINGVAHWLERISAHSAVPLHLLRPTGQTPAAETIRELYSPLSSLIGTKQTTFGNAFVQAVALSAKLANLYTVGLALDTEQHLEVVWKDTFPRSATDKGLEAAALLASGIPEEVIWARVWGFSQEEIADMSAAKSAQRSDVITQAANALANANKPPVTPGQPVTPPGQVAQVAATANGTPPANGNGQANNPLGL